MFDVFDSWSRMMAVSLSAWKTGARAFETSDAAGKVIAARVPMINMAIWSPLNGDYAELGRMVPEKVEAFSQGGSAAVSAWWKAQAMWMAHLQYLGVMAITARPPMLFELADWGTRTADLTVKSLEAAARMGAGSLGPVHSKATSNARRLTRKGARRSKGAVA